MALIQSASWSALGYRQLSNLPRTGGGEDSRQVAQVLCQNQAYEIASNDWVRRAGRRKYSIPLWLMDTVAVLDKNNFADESSLRFVDDYLGSRYPDRKQRLVDAEYQDFVKLTKDAEQADRRWYGVSNLSKAIFGSGPRQLAPLLRDHVLPWFFRTYPDGKVVGISIEHDYFWVRSLLKRLYAVALTPLADLKNEGVNHFHTLEDWQSSSAIDFPSLIIDFFSYLFYPNVWAFQTGKLGLKLVFIFDKAEQHNLPVFPADWLAIPRSRSGFGGEHFDVREVLADKHGPDSLRAGHRRYLHAKEFSAAEMLDLLKWFVSKGNRLYYELTDVANSTDDFDPEKPIDPVLAFEHQLTIDRLIRLTLGVMSVNEVSSAKGGVFEVADLYDAMSELFAKTRKTEFYKRLFNTNVGTNLVSSEFTTLPAPFDAYFRDLTTAIYGELETKIMDSIWLKSKVTPVGVLVRNAALTADNIEPNHKFVANVMRALRNAHHGYFTSPDGSKRSSRYLYPITGNVPDSITTLPALWLIAYLANPSFAGWKHLQVSHYD